METPLSDSSEPHPRARLLSSVLIIEVTHRIINVCIIRLDTTSEHGPVRLAGLLQQLLHSLNTLLCGGGHAKTGMLKQACQG